MGACVWGLGMEGLPPCESEVTLLHMQLLEVPGSGSERPPNLPHIRTLNGNVLSFLSGLPGHSEVTISVQIVRRHSKFLTCLFLSVSVFGPC